MARHVWTAALASVILVAAGQADEPLPDGTTVITESQDGSAAASAELRAKREQLSQLQAEIRALEQQTGEYERVLIRCRFIEADASIVQTLELDWDAEDDARPPLTAVVNTAELDEVVEASRSRGDGRTLAEPSVITMCGRPATIFSGGEFPVLIPGADGDRVEWREFGHRVELVPTVLGGGRLRIQARPQFSERDFTRAVELDGQLIPGLNVQRVQTRFELEFDQSGIVVMRSRSSAAEAECERGNVLDAGAARKVVLFTVAAEPVESGE